MKLLNWFSLQNRHLVFVRQKILKVLKGEKGYEVFPDNSFNKFDLDIEYLRSALGNCYTL